jgi:hypothetical protein
MPSYVCSNTVDVGEETLAIDDDIVNAALDIAMAMMKNDEEW